MTGGTPDLSDHPARSCDQVRVLALTAQIVSAHVAHNLVELPELLRLIHKVYSSLVEVGLPSSSPAGSSGLTPTVSPGRSVFPDYIICLEDGLRFRTLRRHLMAKLGFTPKAYRRRWGLPHDYPMIAPSYALNRSSLAKATGPGRRAPAVPHNSKPSSG